MTDWERIRTMPDADIDLSEIPEITEAQMARAVLRVNGQPVPKGKVLVPLLLDTDVVAYFQEQAGERNYADLMSEVLKNRDGALNSYACCIHSKKKILETSGNV